MEQKSRTQEKNEAEGLQKLGVRLVELSREQVKSLDIPGVLKDAVLFAQTMTRHGARRRQLQFIGALMRKLDPETVTRALEKLDMARAYANRKFKEMEEWRDRLMSDEAAVLDEFMAAYPHADRQQLRQLIRNAKREISSNAPPKAYRNLFKIIRDLMEEGA